MTAATGKMGSMYKVHRDTGWQAEYGTIENAAEVAAAISMGDKHVGWVEQDGFGIVQVYLNGKCLVAFPLHTPAPAVEKRIGDRERNRAVDRLGIHFTAGRITKDEFDQRAGAALTARTMPEIARLFEDLPSLAPPKPMPPKRAEASPPAPRKPVWALTLAGALPLVIAGALLLLLVAAGAFR